MNIKNIKLSEDSPLDEMSLKILFSLPTRSAGKSMLLSLANLFALPFLFIGGIGTALQVYPVITKGLYDAMGQHPLSWVLTLLLALSILGIGWLLRYIHDHFVYEKAPLGTLVSSLFDSLNSGKSAKAQVVSRTLIKLTDGQTVYPQPIQLVRAFSFQVLAEIAIADPDKKQSRHMAEKAIPLYKQVLDAGLKTPLVYFGLATCERIVEQNSAAIHAYKQYLAMKPQDKRTRQIMEQIQVPVTDPPNEPSAIDQDRLF